MTKDASESEDEKLPLKATDVEATADAAASSSSSSSPAAAIAAAAAEATAAATTENMPVHHPSSPHHPHRTVKFPSRLTVESEEHRLHSYAAAMRACSVLRDNTEIKTSEEMELEEKPVVIGVSATGLVYAVPERRTSVPGGRRAALPSALSLSSTTQFAREPRRGSLVARAREQEEFNKKSCCEKFMTYLGKFFKRTCGTFPYEA